MGGSEFGFSANTVAELDRQTATSSKDGFGRHRAMGALISGV
ncbi:MAG: hypothetical protein ABL971_11570 [Vicinamibacterales bacterium]